MPLIITVIAYPREAGVWKMRISGVTESQFSLLRNINPLLKKKSYGAFLSGKWSTQGAGCGRYIPLAYITPVLNILETWGYSLISVEDIEKVTGLGKIWTFRMTRYSAWSDRVLSLTYPSRYPWLDYPRHYDYYCGRYHLPALLPPP